MLSCSRFAGKRVRQGVTPQCRSHFYQAEKGVQVSKDVLPFKTTYQASGSSFNKTSQKLFSPKHFQRLGFWAPSLVECVSAPGRGAGNRWSLRPLPTQPNLWFYDPNTHMWACWENRQGRGCSGQRERAEFTLEKGRGNVLRALWLFSDGFCLQSQVPTSPRTWKQLEGAMNIYKNDLTQFFFPEEHPTLSAEKLRAVQEPQRVAHPTPGLPCSFPSSARERTETAFLVSAPWKTTGNRRKAKK